MNGRRMTDKILSIVPDKEKQKQTLKLVKLWAKRRGIYGSALGYLGGVSWSILVARICLFCPKKCVSDLLQLFIIIYSDWGWPLPIILTRIQDAPDNQCTITKPPVWNPRSNFQDSQHVMPIITPIFPAMNTTHNLHINHLKIISNEFNRAKCILDNIYKCHRKGDVKDK